MNSVHRFTSIGLLVLALGGCRAVNAPLPTGAVDQVDASTNSILQAAHAFASDLTQAVLSIDPQVHIELTTPQKQLLVNLNKALNIADSLEIAYHKNATSTTASALQAATAKVQMALSAAQAVISLTKPTASVESPSARRAEQIAKTRCHFAHPLPDDMGAIPAVALLVCNDGAENGKEGPQ